MVEIHQEEWNASDTKISDFPANCQSAYFPLEGSLLVGNMLV